MNELLLVLAPFLPLIILAVLLMMLVRGERFRMATEKLRSSYGEMPQQGLTADEMLVVHEELRDDKRWKYKRFVSASSGVALILVGLYLFSEYNRHEDMLAALYAGAAWAIGLTHLTRFRPDRRRRLLLKLADRLDIKLHADVSS